MLPQLLSIELYFLRKQKIFIGLSLLFFCLGFMASSMGNVPGGAFINSTLQISFMSAIFSLGTPFIAVTLTLKSALRDRLTEFYSIVDSTPVDPAKLFYSRFLSVFIASVFINALFLMGFMIGTFMPFVYSDTMASFSIISYIYPLVVFVIPNTICVTILVFAIGILSQKKFISYSSAVGIYIYYALVIGLTNSPVMAQSAGSEASFDLAAYLDLFGVSALLGSTADWSLVQKNSMVPGLNGLLLSNRAVWLLLAFAILFLSLRRYVFLKRNIS